ncbi:hypothetical protein NBRC116601_33290 [Cognatishimia sp. WU-CL00825]|uniref:glycoside hydrolase family 16 protein n=1 Tax=Cognatishimia sp. WU-CL00825 TaxID=3127658 RepID=UPI00310708A3
MRMQVMAVLLALVAKTAMAGPDLSGTLPILDESFQQGLNRYDGRSGLWSTLPRRGQLMTNADETVFLDYGVLGAAEDAVLAPLHAVTDEGLALRTVALPDSVKPALRHYMTATGQGKRADKIRFASGEITTAHTWAQTYGYFEVQARIPRGKGRWPAFWMTFAGIGWPPEIDIFEAYGAGIGTRTKKDNTFNTAVFFDTFDADQNPTHSVGIKNPFAATAEGRTPKVRKRGNRNIYNFHQIQKPRADFGANIYDDFHTYAALWTAEHVIFYFGKTRDDLQEIYRTPTPEDVHEPMFLIANDQFTARGGWWGADEKTLKETLDPENAFMLRNITVRALQPAVTLRMQDGDLVKDPRGTTILDTKGDDVIVPGGGFDVLSLSGGQDLLRLRRDRHNKIILGFGPDDRLLLEGYPFEDAADALSRLTQVGEDVWLPSGADPAWPHTLIFRDTQVDRFDAAQFEVVWPIGRDIWVAEAARATRPEFDQDNDGKLAAKGPGAWLNDRSAPVQITGSLGTDRFIVSHRETRITEPEKGGIDTLITWVDYTVPQHIERAIARGDNTRLRGGGPFGQRLEAEATRVFLVGGTGNDLYVIAPAAKFVTVNISANGGHDRLRGFGAGHRLAIASQLRARSDQWQLFTDPEGMRVDFGDNQSLLVEDIDHATLKRLLGLS